MEELEIKFVGYHGTKIENAEKIVDERCFNPSKSAMSFEMAFEDATKSKGDSLNGKAYQWLGDGIYFWNNDKERALKWNKSECAIKAQIIVKESRLADLTTIKMKMLIDFVISTMTIKTKDGNFCDLNKFQRKYIVGKCCDFIQTFFGNPYDVYFCGFDDPFSWDDEKVVFTQINQICVKNNSCISYEKNLIVYKEGE